MKFILILLSIVLILIPLQSQSTRIILSNDSLAPNTGIGVNISPNISGSWQGATFLSQMCRTGTFEGPAKTSGEDLGVIHGWKKYGQGAVYSADTVNPFKGKQCQKIVLDGVNAGIQNWWLKWQLNAANQYTIKFAMRAEGFGSYVDIRLRYWNNGQNQFSDHYYPDGEWKYYEWNFNPVESDELGELYIVGHGPGTIYIDDFQFYITENRREDGFDQKFVDYMKEFKPAALRWGGIGANFDGGFSGNTLAKDYHDGMSYADFFHYCDLIGTKANLVISVADTQDFYQDVNTVERLVEYIGGPAESEGGIRRGADGYGEFLSDSKGLVIEFGNEVWGYTAHGAPWSQETRKEYIAWCRERMRLMRESEHFDEDKYKLAYCGRRANYPWWDRWDMINGEEDEGDWWAISGYMGGDYSEDMDYSSQLNYYMSAFSYLHWQEEQVAEHYNYMEETIGKRLPLFMYEGNFDKTDYFHRLGQAIVYLDYSAAMMRAGVQMPMFFHFATGGQWGLVNNVYGNYKRQPMFYAGKLFNNYCIGNLVNVDVENAPEYTHPAWGEYPERTFDLVSAYAFRDGKSYSLLLINRDFENDQEIVIDFKGLNFLSNAGIYTLEGGSWNDFNEYAGFNMDPETVTIRERSVDDFSDKYSIQLPKHSATVIAFTIDIAGDVIYDEDPTIIVSPNPFSDRCSISYSIEKASNVSLEIYSYLGRKIFDENHGIIKSGSHELDISLGTISQGVYIYRLMIGAEMYTGVIVKAN